MRSKIFVLAMAGAMVISAQASAENSMLGGGIVTVKEQRVGATVALSGTVVPWKQNNLVAQMPGRVEFVAGKAGDRFKKGDLLVKISGEGLKAKWDEAHAGLRMAIANEKNAFVQRRREVISPQKKTTQGGMGMPSMVDQMFTAPMADMSGYNDRGEERFSTIHNMDTNVRKANEGVRAAEAGIKNLRTKFRDLETRAPYDGVIIQKLTEVGNPVQPNMPLVVFADLRRLQIDVNVPARLMSGVKEGDNMHASLDVGDVGLQVRVAQIFPVAESMQHTVKVKFDLPPSSPAAPGMYARIWVRDVSTQIKDVPVIPKSAIKWRGSLPGVYVINASSNRPELRLIRIGENYGSDAKTVLSGLRAGERILASPAGRAGWGGK